MLNFEPDFEPGSVSSISAKSDCCWCQSITTRIEKLNITEGVYKTNKLQALFLPEASDYIGSSAAETVSLARSVQDSEFVQGLQKEARDANLHINVGIHEPAPEGRVKNTLVWIDEKGDITQRYQKTHLFDVEIKDGPILKESS